MNSWWLLSILIGCAGYLILAALIIQEASPPWWF
jgi:hypothetical protein